jgi:pimeloyl-ACP methyl ester carboxylesterase
LIAGVLALTLAVLAIYAAWPHIARALVFMPNSSADHASDPGHVYPSSGARSISIPSPGGLYLHGWWFPARGRPCGTALYLYGNKGNLASRGDIADALAKHRLNVLLLDYRGYGGSPGTPTEAGLYQDARNAYRWLREAQKVPPEQILLMGHSIGAALATGVAADEPVAGLVLLSPFSSFPGATRAQLPWAPGRITDWGGHRFPAAQDISLVTAPVLAIRGTEDAFTSRADAHRVFAAAGGPATWVDVEGAGHNDLLSYRSAWDAIAAFRDRALRCGQGTPSGRGTAGAHRPVSPFSGR